MNALVTIEAELMAQPGQLTNEGMEIAPDIDTQMAGLVGEIDSAYSPEDEEALALNAAYKADSACDSPTQEWRE